MKRLCKALLAAQLAYVAAHKVPADLLKQEFAKFVSDYGKVYQGAEYEARFAVFAKNFQRIQEVNAKGLSYQLRINKFSDLSQDEFTELYGLQTLPRVFKNQIKPLGFAEPPPESIDWAALGKVTPVQDQGTCGACYAFAAVAAVESAWAIANNDGPVKLSEQQVVDCSGEQLNNGCKGGYPDYVFQYVTQNGICTEDSYSYKGSQSNCTSQNCTAAIPPAGGPGLSVVSFRDIDPDADPTQAVAQQPIAAGLVITDELRHYSGGVLNIPNCSTFPQNHFVTIVGYGVDTDGTLYWKAKNSWGTSWGEGGYFRILRGKTKSGSMCGIEGVTSYPVVGGSSPSPPGPSSPTHYERPAQTTPPCRPDELYAQVMGDQGLTPYFMCAPSCGNSCPRDVPPTTSGELQPGCGFYKTSGRGQYCGIPCETGSMSNGGCAEGASCVESESTSWCAYQQANPAPGATPLTDMLFPGQTETPITV